MTGRIGGSIVIILKIPTCPLANFGSLILQGEKNVTICIIIALYNNNYCISKDGRIASQPNQLYFATNS